jgi:hypothetical protein
MITNVTGVACSRQEFEALQAQIHYAYRVEEAAQAYNSALAIAGGDPALAKGVERLRQDSFSDAVISAYVALVRAAKADPAIAAKIETARAAGATDAQICLAEMERIPVGADRARANCNLEVRP